MQQHTNKPKRAFTDSAAVMLVAAETIAESALAHVGEIEEADTTYTSQYFKDFHTTIDNAVRNILGADNAAALRANTINLGAAHTDAHHQLDLTRLLIQNKFAKTPARRDELLNTLGFRAFYEAAYDSQPAMTSLLSHFAENLTPALEAELTTAGLPLRRIDALRSYAATYNSLNVTQEGSKGARKELTDADVLALNDIYHQAIAISQAARSLFKDHPATRDRFIYSQLVARQKSYHTGGNTGGTSTPPVQA